MGPQSGARNWGGGSIRGLWGAWRGEDLFGEGGLVVSKIGNLPPLPPKIHCPVPDDSEEEAEP